jgi:hypothetical protein
VQEDPFRTADRPAAPAGANRRLSALAVAAVVVAVIPLCPLTGLLGALLGVLALRRIRLSGGRLGGRRTALAAIIIGVACAFVWSAVLDRVAHQQRQWQEKAMVEAVTAVIEADRAPDRSAALQAWSSLDSHRPADEEILRFSRETAARYGRRDRVAIISTSRSISLSQPEVEVAGVFHFADEAPLGSARFALEAVPGRIMPVFRLTRLMIEDQHRGNLILGSASDNAGAAPGAPGAPGTSGAP